MRFAPLLTLLLLWLASPHMAAAAENTPSASGNRTEDSLRERKLTYYRSRLADHRITFADAPDEPFDFIEDPVNQYDNPISHIYDGFTFLWTHQGRPLVVLKSYYNQPQASWGRTFVSLAPRPLELRIDGQKRWYPRGGALRLEPLANAPPPAASAPLRLAQMRRIAGEFEVVDSWGRVNPTDWQLRLLTAPLYRYEVPDENVVDGALFGYAITTSPEALLLIEARDTDQGLQWQYAVSRCTRFGITFSRDGRLLAEFPRLDAWPPTGTYFHIPVPLPDYPFAEDAAR